MQDPVINLERWRIWAQDGYIKRMREAATAHAHAHLPSPELHCPCHGKVHAVFTEAELARWRSGEVRFVSEMIDVDQGDLGELLGSSSLSRRR